jgi:hypothetical protein
MSTPLSRHRRRWWKVIVYEVWMLRAMISIQANHPIRGDERLANSVSENRPAYAKLVRILLQAIARVNLTVLLQPLDLRR